MKYEKTVITNPYCTPGRKNVPEVQMSERLINELLTRGAVTCIKSYQVVSQDAYKEFIYDIGLLPELLEHDLAEAEYYGD